MIAFPGLPGAAILRPRMGPHRPDVKASARDPTVRLDAKFFLDREYSLGIQLRQQKFRRARSATAARCAFIASSTQYGLAWIGMFRVTKQLESKATRPPVAISTSATLFLRRSPTLTPRQSCQCPA